MEMAPGFCDSESSRLRPRSYVERKERAVAGESTSTTDHMEIRRWVEARGGRPAAVSRTRSDDDPGIIRIDFPGYSGEDSLESISWEEWFQKFEDGNLALVFQETTGEGERSNFNRLVKRD
jgi:hypothetical protein